MTTAGHDPWQDRLSEYLDGELAADERAALEDHLAGCAGCRGLLVELREIAGAARALPGRAPERDLWPDLRASLGAAPGARVRPRWLVPFAAGVLLSLGASLAVQGLERATPVVQTARGESYLMLLHEPEGFASGQSEPEHLATVERYARWARELGERCTGGEELEVDGVELRAGPGEVTLGERAFVPGIGGYFLVQVADRGEALELARSCPHLEQGGWIELRRVRVNP